MRFILPLTFAFACGTDAVEFQPALDDDGGGGSDTGTNPDYFGKICDAIDEDGTCSVYTGSAWDVDFAQQNCVAGTFTVGALCPPATLGTCTFAIGQPLERVAHYYVGVWYDAAEEDGVASNCGFGEGEWSSANASSR